MLFGARDQIRTGIPFEVFDLSYSQLANRSQLSLPLATISGIPESLFASGLCEVPGHATLIVGAR
jgi:hypothetical protein